MTLDVQFQCTEVALDRLVVLGDALFHAIQASSRWRIERRTGKPTTGCLVAFIPRRQHLDISIQISVGHTKGLELITQLQLEAL